jgi:type III pantothenate kinase
MILCLDVGNSHICGGVFEGDTLLLRFRYATKQLHTSDEIGVFFRSVFRENNIQPDRIKEIAIASVVPDIDYSLRAACIKYFNIEPFILEAGVKTGLKIKTAYPAEVGADLIAGAIAAIQQFPKQHLIIVDFGTATTYTAINHPQEFLGVVILPGLKIAMDALKNNAAKLPSVEITKPSQVLGRSTIESIQIGLYYSQLASLKEITLGISQHYFNGEQPAIIGTGGFSHLFSDENIFTHLEPDLILKGIYLALLKNRQIV